MISIYFFRDVSQTTLQDIKNLENSLTQSAAVRSSTQDIQSRNDQRRIIVQNITTNVILDPKFLLLLIFQNNSHDWMCNTNPFYLVSESNCFVFNFFDNYFLL